MSLRQLRPKTRIAIAQLPMQWSCAANTTAILESLATAADRGAQICVFPELALTGFHRQIRTEAQPTRIGDALRQIQSLCRQRVIACVVGTPTFDGEASPFNSHVHIDERGEIAAIVSKIGLTPSETTFFAAGVLRPIAVLQGIACTSVPRDQPGVATFVLGGKEHEWMPVAV
jgi:omega-amidase